MWIDVRAALVPGSPSGEKETASGYDNNDTCLTFSRVNISWIRVTRSHNQSICSYMRSALSSQRHSFIRGVRRQIRHGCWQLHVADVS